MTVPEIIERAKTLVNDPEYDYNYWDWSRCAAGTLYLAWSGEEGSTRKVMSLSGRWPRFLAEELGTSHHVISIYANAGAGRGPAARQAALRVYDELLARWEAAHDHELR